MNASAAPTPRATAARLGAALSLLNRHWRYARREGALGGAALAVLSRIHRQPAITPSQLAQLAGVRLQSLTRLLSSLESDGLVRREAHAGDRRQSVLNLTPPGRQALRDEAQRREAALAKAIGRCLSAEQSAALNEACALLERIGDALASGAGE